MVSTIVTLPLPPNMANGRVHHWAKHKARRQYLVACDELVDRVWNARQHGWSKPPMHWRVDGKLAEPQKRVRLSFLLAVGGRMDDDNALARCKWPVDWLVVRGYLVDDKPAHCRMTIPQQIITRKKAEQRVVITIAPLTDAPMVGQDREPAESKAMPMLES